MGREVSTPPSGMAKTIGLSISIFLSFSANLNPALFLSANILVVIGFYQTNIKTHVIFHSSS
jgi:hypothetical protein